MSQIADDLIARLPFNAVNDSGFRRLFDRLQPDQPLPDEASVEEASRLETNGEIDLESVEPISVSMDIQVNQRNEKYCVFSAHFIDNAYKRTNAVFFKKFKNEALDSSKLWAAVTEGFAKNNYKNVKIANAIFSSTNVAKSFTTGVALSSRKHICFFFLINKFIREMIEHVDIQMEVCNIGVHIDTAKKNLTASEFEIIFQNVAAPRIDDFSWLVRSGNLAKWMKAYRTLQPEPPYQSHLHDFEETYQKMEFVFKILQLCHEKTLFLSKPDSMLSQVLPSVIAIRRYISNFVDTRDFAKRIWDQLNETLIILKSEHYSLATFLDPRYVYDVTIYRYENWKGFETALKKSYPATAPEIPVYRRLAEAARTNDVDVDPLKFWAHAESLSLTNLARMARQYLASPAVAVDANYFFGETSGKFSRICEMYKNEKLEGYLKAAAVEQEFVGKGAFSEVSMCLEAPEPRVKASMKRCAAMGQELSAKRSIHAFDYNGNPFATVKPKTPSLPPQPLVERKPEQLNLSPSAEEVPAKEIKQEVIVEPEMEDQTASIVPKEEVEDPGYEHREATTSNQNKFKLPTIRQPMQEIEMEEEEEIKLSSSWDVKPAPQVRCPGRYCGQCDRNDKPMKLMQGRNGLLLVLVCAVRHKNLSFLDAVKQFRRNHPLFCIEHCHETCDDIFTIFDVGRPEDIANLPIYAFRSNFMDICSVICNGSMEITKESMKEACYQFTAKYIREPCIVCSQKLYRMEMFNVSKEATNLTTWIEQKRIPIPLKFEELDGDNLASALREDTFSYICKDHFPKIHNTKNARRLMRVDE